MSSPIQRPVMTVPASSTERLVGWVKWFNKKSGYGFLTIYEGELKGKDIYVHYTSLRVADTQTWKYLIQGEYVEFVFDKSYNESHEFQAKDITGILGGPLLCETVYKNSEEFLHRRPSSSVKEGTDDAEFTKVQSNKGKKEARSYSSILRKEKENL